MHLIGVPRNFVKYTRMFARFACGERNAEILFFFFFSSAQLPLPIFVYVHFSRCTFSSRFSPHLHLFVLRYFRAAVFYFLQFYVPPPPPPRPVNKLMISCVAMWWPRKCIFHTFSFVHDIKVLNLTTSQMPA